LSDSSKPRHPFYPSASMDFRVERPRLEGNETVSRIIKTNALSGYNY
jgi:hypothetical protein